jgi:hypothetical protein
MHLPSAAKALRPFVAKCTVTTVAGEDATSLVHLVEMLDKIESEQVTGEKGHRWLGWAQAVICCRGGASLDEMKLVNYTA